MLFQLVRLLGISITDITHNQVYFLESVKWVLELLARLSILLVYILGHEFFPLFNVHVEPAFNLSRLYHIVVANLADIEQDLAFTTIFFLQVVVKTMDLAVVARAYQA